MNDKAIEASMTAKERVLKVHRDAGVGRELHPITGHTGNVFVSDGHGKILGGPCKAKGPLSNPESYTPAWEDAASKIPVAAPLAPQSAPSETFAHALAGYLTRNGQVGNLPDCQREIEDFMRAKPESAPSAPAEKDYCTKGSGGNLCSRDAGHEGDCGPYEDEDDIEFRCKDDPEANNRTARIGEQRFTMKFPLDDGRDLRIHMGRSDDD